MNQIIIDKDSQSFLINTESSSYGFAVNKAGNLTNVHWGGRINGPDDLPDVENLLNYRHRREERGSLLRQEYPGWGDAFYDEPALKVTFEDGVRGILLKYHDAVRESFNGGEELIVTLKDAYYPLEIKLFYRVFHDSGILERHAELCNRGDQTLTLESVMSCAWNLPRIDGDYRLSHLAGRWAREATINRQPVKQNKITLESRTGLSGPFAMPFFALDRGDATEDAGEVWFGTLQWNGNWKITVNRDAFEEVSVIGGINDFDFKSPLHPGESFRTPVFCAGVSHSGFGGASRMLHDYQRAHLLPKAAEGPMPLLVNTWASLHAAVDEASVLGVIDKAAEVGAELFVIDDGWQCALGDWTPDPVKFPNGLEPVIARAKKLGMNFGLWVEIESFETSSRLYAEHPDWAMRYQSRPVHGKYRADVDRTSCLINFAREDVREHFRKVLSELIASTKITYLKLDMNYFFTDPGWPEVLEEESRTIWHRYATNVLRLFEDLNQEFPQVRFENCASGGARSDLAMSRYFGRINRSDNQDPLDVLKLHEGFTWMHLPGLAGGACHISDDMYYVNLRRMSLEFQAIAGMLGSLAIGKNLPECPDEEIAAIRKWGELYKKFRKITYYGDLYRLESLNDKPYAVFEYVSKDRSEALVFLFVREFQFSTRLPTLRLRGLDPERNYAITAYGAESIDKDDYHSRSGKSFMEIGVQSDMLGDHRARILHLLSREGQGDTSCPTT